MGDSIKISVKDNKSRGTKTIKAKIWFASEIEIPNDDYENLATRTYIEETLKNNLMHYISKFSSLRIRPFE